MPTLRPRAAARAPRRRDPEGALHVTRVRRPRDGTAVEPGLAGRVPRRGDRATGRLLRVHDRRPVDPRRAGQRRRDPGVLQPLPAPGYAARVGCRQLRDGQIRCRYHAWQYALDGELVEVVDREEFTELPDGLRLGDVRAECWGGFVFVNPDAERGTAARLPRIRSRSCSTATTSTRCGSARTRPRSFPRTGRSSSTRSTRATTCRARIRSCSRGPTMSASSTSSSRRTHATGGSKNSRRRLTPSPRLGLRDDEIDHGADPQRPRRGTRWRVPRRGARAGR